MSETRGDMENRWKFWRWDRKEAFNRDGPLFLESRELSCGVNPDDQDAVPSWTLYIRFDECSHLHAKVTSPDVQAALGGTADAIGDYMHICGAQQFDFLIAALAEAKQIAVEWYGGTAKGWL